MGYDKRLDCATRYTSQSPTTFDGSYWLYTEAVERCRSSASGKWLVFVYLADVDRYWGIISHAVKSGRLGSSAKVATAAPSPLSTNPRVRLICVYTDDWHDKDDVRRVLQCLRELGISWPLSYKTDEATLDGRYGAGTAIYVSQAGSDDFDDRTSAAPMSKPASDERAPESSGGVRTYTDEEAAALAATLDQAWMKWAGAHGDELPTALVVDADSEWSRRVSDEDVAGT